MFFQTLYRTVSIAALVSSGAISPEVFGDFIADLGDYTTLSTLSSMPTDGSVSRSGNAYYFDNTGTLQTAGTNTARFDYAWNGSAWAAKGLLIEGARTNVFLNSTTPATQSITVTAQAYTLSFYGTGTITLSGASTAGPLVGTGANNRVTLTFTPSAASLTLTLSGTVNYPQLEAGSFASSYIVCGGTATTRNAETFTLANYTNRLVESFYVDEQTGGSWSANIAPSATSPLSIGTPTFGWVTSLRAYLSGAAGSIATPSWIDNSGTVGNRMMYDSTGLLTYAPANLLTGSATLSTQTVTDGVAAGRNFVLSFKGTGSVVVKETNSGGTTIVTINGTGASDRVWGAFTATVATLYVSVSGTVTEAQLEPVTYQTAPRPYIATTTAAIYLPRYDYSPATTPATPLGMLVEESRANLVTYSEQFNNAAWTGSGLLAFGSGSTADATVAPSGTTTADLLTENSSTSTHYIDCTSITFTAAKYTISVFAKYNGRRYLTMQGSSVVFSTDIASFDLVSGSASFASAGSTATIAAVGNGWYRCSWTITTAAASGVVTLLLSDVSGTRSRSYTGDGVSGIYLWGAQVELGAFPTSYIPNNSGSGSVTRAADIVKLTGSALTTIGGTAGTVVEEINLRGTTAATQYGIYGNSVSPGYFDSALVVKATNGTNVLSSGVTAVVGTAGRFGLAWDASGRAISYSGSAAVTDANGFGTIGSTVYIGSNNASNTANGWVRSMALYNQKLSSATLAQKTTVGASY